MKRLTADQSALARQLLAALGQDTPEAANDADPEIDEQAIRELARRDVEKMRRARNR